MDILKILQESGAELYPEDLDFFETELATAGIYDEAYQKQCMTIIRQLRSWLCGEKPRPDDTPAPQDTRRAAGGTSGGVEVNICDLAPKASNSAAASLTPTQLIHREIVALRDESAYKTNFKNYVASKPEIDAAFIDAHYSFFQPWELDAIISVKQMPEEFLEKYFGALDHDKIARYQQFSEGFFMKHFSQMNAEIVLEHGKNPWRKKEDRSKQLDVFLRLKGVKL